VTELKKGFYVVHIFLFPFKCIFGNQKYAKICSQNIIANVVTIDALVSSYGNNIWVHVNIKWKRMETTTSPYSPRQLINICAPIVERDTNIGLAYGSIGSGVIRSPLRQVRNFSLSNTTVT